MAAIKRLETERVDLEKEGYVVEKQADNLWLVHFAGPKQTPFEGGRFVIEVKLENFPFKGPVIHFKTQIYHPNVSEKGEVCRDMIETGEKWVPTKRLTKVMQKIMNLLYTPNLETPMNEKAAAAFKNGNWENQARADTQKYAK